jgi:hypothetical protein
MSKAQRQSTAGEHITRSAPPKPAPNDGAAVIRQEISHRPQRIRCPVRAAALGLRGEEERNR